ncbi:hypothetical protein K7I13_10990 [Brucepastera parasyntrophica]|uniref:hypothetical protein n=1 Tax=Brucepastera parasyntrophica TaxID=2880008 RepID=UPI00210BF056|nr:hypothetical protein [Brucepastera parasyntrophica]ULQ59033.1 hypothetical protein K7I13_10990 [Brucepastera parasyntrophica]
MYESGLPDKGNISASALFILAILMAFCAGSMMLLSSTKNYAARLQTKDSEYGNAFEVLHRIQKDIGILAEDPADSPLSSGLQTLAARYEGYGLQIRDVSSGIHIRFLNDGLLKKEAIQRLIQFRPEENIVQYGWANANIISEAARNQIRRSFALTDNEKLFPLINTFPATNLHYLSEECLEAFFSAYQIKKAREKAALIFLKTKTELVTNIEDVLEIKKDHELFNLIGYKTTFWEVTFHHSRCTVRAVFCAIPDRKNAGKIESYRLIERNVVYDFEKETETIIRN